MVVNKLNTMDSTYFSKLFYLLNQGVYLYHKMNSHTSNLKLIIKKKKKHDELYSLIITHTKKKVIYRFYTSLFVCVCVCVTKLEMVSQKIIFFVLSILKFFLKSWIKTYIYIYIYILF